MNCNYSLIISFEDKEVIIDEYLDFLDEIQKLREKYDFIKAITIGVE